MRPGLSFVFAALLLCGKCVAGPATLEIIDLFPGFLQCFDISPANGEERSSLFSQRLLAAYPEIYRRPTIFRTDPGTLKSYLDQVVVYLPTIKEIHTRFLNECEPVEKSFCALFKDFNRSRVKIYLMFSLFRFDGKIPHDDSKVLFLALDGLARFHGAGANLGVLLSHELFHLYHFQVNPLPANADELPLYRLIWQEGLATYVSALMNPGATLADVLLDPRLARDGPACLPAAAAELIPKLESADDLTAGKYLSYRRGGKTPSRMGYLIGYEIAAHLAATRSIQALSRLRGQRLLRLIRQEVQRLALQ